MAWVGYLVLGDDGTPVQFVEAPESEDVLAMRLEVFTTLAGARATAKDLSDDFCRYGFVRVVITPEKKKRAATKPRKRSERSQPWERSAKSL